MGGLGSGSRNRWANKTHEFHKLDLATFEKQWFENYRGGMITWSRGGHKTGCINYYLSPQSMRLSYVSGSGESKQSIDESFQFDFTNQPFGGKRRWIICKSCGQRCRVLYGAKLFRCRKCYGATYESQYETIRVPGLARAERLKEKMGGEAGMINPLPAKPKGMHWKTYRSHEHQYYDAERRMNLALMQKFKAYG